MTKFIEKRIIDSNPVFLLSILGCSKRDKLSTRRYTHIWLLAKYESNFFLNILPFFSIYSQQKKKKADSNQSFSVVNVCIVATKNNNLVHIENMVLKKRIHKSAIF
jgi:hypothetical protein